MERENIEESTTKESAEKENELHTQIGLSLLSGLVASMAPIALDVQTPEWACIHYDFWLHDMGRA